MAYKSISVYVPMPDGVKIAVDIWLPKAATKENKVPVAVEFTRYWRVRDGKAPMDRVLYYPRLGFASAVVDCRGSGASHGFRAAEQSVAEAKDFAFVINWLAAQPWSNGSVVSVGSSYSGNTAEFAMIDAPYALKASIPRFSDFDTYTSLCFPGGLINKTFLKPWGEGVYALDMNIMDVNLHERWHDFRHDTVKPVEEDCGRTLLRQAVEDHQRNVPLHEYLAPIEYRDDFHFAGTLNEEGDRWVSPHLVQSNARLSQVPSYHWASFNDAGTAAGAIARFMGSRAAMRVIIGYWSHGAFFDTNPYKVPGLDAKPNYKEQFTHIIEGLSALKSTCDEELIFAKQRVLYYYTAGEEAWKKTEVWPPKKIRTMRWYFSDNASLSQEQPQCPHGQDRYLVDFDVGTGKQNRWVQEGGVVHYGNRAELDERLLTYTTEPLLQTVEITGHPVIYLQLSASQGDGAVIAYLEDVAPNGEVTLLSEGGLRLIHRKVSDAVPPYPIFGPYHSFERQDASPMVRGEIAEIGFELLPLSVQIRKGHAIRIALAGHDKDCFDRLPRTGEQHYGIHRHLGANSYIDIPMASIEEDAEASDVVDPFCEGDCG